MLGNPLTLVIGGLASLALIGGVSTVAINRAIPSHFDHSVNVDGNVTVRVDVTVHTPDLEKLKPGTLVPDHIDIRLPEGFKLYVPDSQQTVDVHAPTDFTVKQK